MGAYNDFSFECFFHIFHLIALLLMNRLVKSLDLSFQILQPVYPDSNGTIGTLGKNTTFVSDILIIPSDFFKESFSSFRVKSLFLVVNDAVMTSQYYGSQNGNDG